MLASGGRAQQMVQHEQQEVPHVLLQGGLATGWRAKGAVGSRSASPSMVAPTSLLKMTSKSLGNAVSTLKTFADSGS